MATVYLAQDLKHDRQVALKVLKPELAAVLGVERFLTEIKTTAHLQHPNILQLFDSGIADGLLYYVMPFIEGESLRVRLTREKQLPIDDAIAIARGAAAALHYAHCHGVIHRDIKPENILLQDGQPLVADFGIALAVKAAGGVRLTQTGVAIGTPQYMSPEQATAERELDPRSDVYSLAAVTYEMFGGEPPLSGPTPQAVIAKLLTDEPRPLSALRKSVPPRVEHAIHRALERLPADRFGTAAEFAAALAEGKTVRSYDRGVVGQAVASQPPNRRPLRSFGLIAAGIVLVALVAGWLAFRGVSRQTRLLPLQSNLLPPAGRSVVSSGSQRIIDISHDGEVIAYAANGPTSDHVVLQRIDGTETGEVSGGGSARNLRLSPDGQYLYSPRGSGAMQKILVTGGSWTPLADVPATPFLTPASDGTLWWSPLHGGIFRLRPGADSSERLLLPDSTTRRAVIQQVLPEDRLALVVTATANGGRAAVLDLQRGTMRELLDFPIVEVRYSAGVLVYASPDQTLYAVRFNAREGRVIGEPVALDINVAVTAAGVAQFAVAGNGTLIYVPPLAEGRELSLVDRSGGVRLLEKGILHGPRFSPDGRRILYDQKKLGRRNVHVFDREEGRSTQLTFEGGVDPVWTADGKAILFSSEDAFRINRVNPGAGGGADTLFASELVRYTGLPLPGDSTLVTTSSRTRAGQDRGIVLIHLGRKDPVQPLFESRSDEGWAAPSPDGKWVAFTSRETGRQEVYISPLGGKGNRLQVSPDGGTEPVWARDGRELFYRRSRPGQDQVDLMVARLRLGSKPEVVKPVPLFDVSNFEVADPHANYDVSPDGQSFVMLRRSPKSYVVLLQNLPGHLERRQRNGPR